jgi:hypothetical protein
VDDKQIVDGIPILQRNGVDNGFLSHIRERLRVGPLWIDCPHDCISPFEPSGRNKNLAIHAELIFNQKRVPH